MSAGGIPQYTPRASDSTLEACPLHGRYPVVTWPLPGRYMAVMRPLRAPAWLAFGKPWENSPSPTVPYAPHPQ
jgi:hypothetical protein